MGITQVVFSGFYAKIGLVLGANFISATSPPLPHTPSYPLFQVLVAVVCGAGGLNVKLLSKGGNFSGGHH